MSQTGIASGRLVVYADPDDLADRVAAWLTGLAQQAADRFSVCLSGGSTPKILYARLAQAPYRDTFPWDRTHLFFGDERFVPAGHKDSNFTMADEALLKHVPIPASNIHRMVTETASAAQTAADYEAELKRYYGAETLDPARPLFDVNFLGLGPDGHTASLIPGQPVLEERNRWVADVPKGRDEQRITLTYPAIESSRHIAFLLTGAGKTEMLSHLRSGATDVPAARLETSGEVIFFADKAAAGA